jgi:hypothetical protein
VKTLPLAVGLLVPLCSCRVGPPRGSFAPFSFDFGRGLEETIVIGHGIWLSALQMCSRTQDELLQSAGQPFCFDAQFRCDAPQGSARFCVVGLGGPESEAAWAGAFSEAEMFSGCVTVKRMLAEMSPSRYSNWQIYIYLCRQEAPLEAPLIRLGFHGAIESPGMISITCESAELVSWNDLRFIDPPPSKRSD